MSDYSYNFLQLLIIVYYYSRPSRTNRALGKFRQLAPETKDPQVPSLQTNKIRCICFTFQPPGPLDFLLNDVSNMDRFNCKYCKWAKGSKEAIELNVFHSSCFVAYSLVVASLASTRSEGSCRPMSPAGHQAQGLEARLRRIPSICSTTWRPRAAKHGWGGSWRVAGHRAVASGSKESQVAKAWDKLSRACSRVSAESQKRFKDWVFCKARQQGSF